MPFIPVIDSSPRFHARRLPRRWAPEVAAAFLLALVTVTCGLAQNVPTQTTEYAQLQERLAQGWNTWDTHSVMTQVLLPEGFAIHLGIEQRSTEGSNSFLQTALIGELGKGDPQVFPGPHAYDGSYTDMKLMWNGYKVRIQTAHDGSGVVMLVTPLAQNPHLHLPPGVVFSANMLWNRSGSISKKGETIQAKFTDRTVNVYLAGKDTHDVDASVSGPYFTAVLSHPVGLSTGRSRTIAEIREALGREKRTYEDSISKFGKLDPVADAIQTVIGWDTIYEPEKQRVVTPVSRLWNVHWGGYVLFDWDTFFTSTLAAVGDRDLAYANAIEICREETREGFVPNYARAHGWKSNDRSEPPVGSITVLGLYRKFHDKWVLGETYPALLRWNRWWAQHRDRDGYLVWGSDGENQPVNLDDSTVGTREGAILESGLDNSPMYDSAVYDARTHQLEYADVGLMSMYIADCDALAKIAEVLGKTADETELHQRAAKYRAKLDTMWNPKLGVFLNRDLHTGKYNLRLSPTNFYPMLADAATPAQAERMVTEHLLNPKEFWGTWVIPSIERSDAAFTDQNYWRGRIWGPMNYLVYLGLENYQSPTLVRARQELAQKSLALFLKGWNAHGHVHENYNAMTGVGDDVKNSDRFYTWGALLGLMSLDQLHGSSDPQSNP
ncbi:MAG: trehalase family glycosidase [Acidobacteriaceae bacterium]